MYRPGDIVLEGEIEEGKAYFSKDFNRSIIIEEREEERVKKLLTEIDQNEKTLVFCATQKHALLVRDLINKYKKKYQLTADLIGRGGAWLDSGSIEDFYKTSSFVSAIENRQGFKIACLEEIALNNGWIKRSKINDAIKFYGNCEYSNYLKKL